MQTYRRPQHVTSDKIHHDPVNARNNFGPLASLFYLHLVYADRHPYHTSRLDSVCVCVWLRFLSSIAVQTPVLWLNGFRGLSFFRSTPNLLLPREGLTRTTEKVGVVKRGEHTRVIFRTQLHQKRANWNSWSWKTLSPTPFTSRLGKVN